MQQMKVKVKTITLSLLFVLGLFTAKAQSQENKIQAIFVLKFVENVSWPKEKKGLVIGVVGSSEVLTEIENRLKLKNPDEIIVKKISASESGSCDVVFLPSVKDNQLGSINDSVGGKSVLVITESDLVKKGAGISFHKENGKLQFLINKSEVEAKGMKIGSALLSLGSQV
jgi:hypothetical protein